MSMAAGRDWRCDRCSDSAETSLQDQPSNWASVLVWSPPLQNPGEEGVENPRKHLCRRCARDVREFISTAPAHWVGA